MKHEFRLSWILGIVCYGWTGCGSPAATQPPEAPPHEHAAHEHAEEQPASAPSGEAIEHDAPSAQGEQAVGPEELAAYEKARPLFEAYCATCHTRKGAKATPASLEHFAMDGYPFGGHHATEITATIRQVLGATGSKPTMPRDKPGAVKGDELRTIVGWADAYDRAHATHAAGTHHEGNHEH